MSCIKTYLLNYRYTNIILRVLLEDNYNAHEKIKMNNIDKVITTKHFICAKIKIKNSY